MKVKGNRRYRFNNRRKRRGMSILVALMVVSTLIMLASVGLKISSDEAEITNYDLYAMQAELAAESGLMHAATALGGDSSFASTVYGTMEVTFESTAEAAVTDPEDPEFDERRFAFYETHITLNRSNNTGRILSTGRYMGVSKKLSAEIEKISPLKMKKAVTSYE